MVPCSAGFVFKLNLPHHNVGDVNSFSLSHPSAAAPSCPPRQVIPRSQMPTAEIRLQSELPLQGSAWEGDAARGSAGSGVPPPEPSTQPCSPEGAALASPSPELPAPPCAWPGPGRGAGGSPGHRGGQRGPASPPSSPHQLVLRAAQLDPAGLTCRRAGA